MANDKPKSSWENEESRLKLYILPEFGHRALQSILTREWEAFFDKLIGEGLMGAGTRNRIRALMSKMYNDAMRVGDVTCNPISNHPSVKGEDGWLVGTTGTR